MSEPTTQELLARIDRLERRVLSLEGATFKRGALARAVRHVIAKWPGPFTAQQIRDAVYEFFPEVKPVEEHHQIEVLIQRMDKQGQITRTFEGRGPSANIYVFNPEVAPARKGNKRGCHAANESGFRNIVRRALEDLPEQWRLEDLRRWVDANLPDARIPYGSWTSTLYKLTQAGELEVRGHRHYEGGKVYSRGPKRVMPSGAELSDLDKAWTDFRSNIKAELPELLPGLKRAEM